MVMTMSEPETQDAGMGHNSGDDASDVGGIAGKRLQSFLDRVERLEEEKSALTEDIKEVKAEAKSAGFEIKIINKMLKIRKMDTEKRREEDELLNLYMSAVGME